MSKDYFLQLFWTTKYLLYTSICLIYSDRVGDLIRSLFKSNFQTPKRGPKYDVSALWWAKQKLLEITRWLILPRKVSLWMKVDDLGLVVRSDPPAWNGLPKTKSERRRGLRKELKPKNALNHYFGEVKNFQNIRLSHFLTVEAQKGSSIRSPLRSRVKRDCDCKNTYICLKFNIPGNFSSHISK